MYLGDFRTGVTIRFAWNTNAIAGESITRATNGTIRIYKNASTTERTSSNGITDTEDFDSLTGVHHLAIDLSDNTDSGFYAAGNDYLIVLAAATIDGKTINAFIAGFSIENRNPQVDVTKWNGTAVATPNTAGVPKVDVTQFNGVNCTSSSGRPEVNSTHWGGTAVASANVRANLVQILGTAPTESGSGRLAGAFTTCFDVAAPVFTTASVNQTGDNYSRIGATGSGLTSLAPAATALSTAQWTNTRAGYQDNIATVPPTAAAIRSEMDTNSSKLANLDVASSTRLATAGYTAPDNAGIASAGSSASAAVTNTIAIKLKTDNLPASPAATGDAMTLTSGERSSIATAVWNFVSEGTEKIIETIRLVRAMTVGKSSGFPAGPYKFRDAGDTKDRVTMTGDADGNRTGSTTDGT